MRSSNDPFSGIPAMIDKRIGDAFPVVETVANNIEHIKYVEYNMAAIVAAATAIPYTHRLVTSTSGVLGSTVQVPLPEDLTIAQLVSSQVMLVTEGDVIFMEGSSIFSASIQGGTLRFTLSSTAPSNAIGAEIRWLLSFAPFDEE